MSCLVNVDDRVLDGMTDEQAGDCMVFDEEYARKVLEMHLAHTTDGVEPVLYDDEKSWTTNMVDEDILAQVIELQLRMDKGIKMIEGMQVLFDNVHLEEYLKAKEAFQKAKDYLSAYKNKNGSIEGFPYWDKFNLLKAERDGRYSLMMEKRAELSRYWDHWKFLKGQCQSLVRGDKAIWAVYFQIEDKRRWLEDYKNKDLNPVNDPADIDEMKDLYASQKETSDILLFTYLLEQREELSYIN